MHVCNLHWVCVPFLYLHYQKLYRIANQKVNEVEKADHKREEKKTQLNYLNKLKVEKIISNANKCVQCSQTNIYIAVWCEMWCPIDK